MRFLFVRPEFCPLGDLSTPKIRLSSDSTSRWTPLPLAKPSHYRATSGLSPYRTCAHRAHYSEGTVVLRQSLFKLLFTSVFHMPGADHRQLGVCGFPGYGLFFFLLHLFHPLLGFTKDVPVMRRTGQHGKLKCAYRLNSASRYFNTIKRCHPERNAAWCSAQLIQIE